MHWLIIVTTTKTAKHYLARFKNIHVLLFYSPAVKNIQHHGAIGRDYLIADIIKNSGLKQFTLIAKLFSIHLILH